jgi:elongation factor 1-gamma
MGFVAPVNARISQLCIAAKLAGLEVELPASFQMNVDNETESFVKNFSPAMRTPVAQTEEGAIFESGAILRYIARAGEKTNKTLYGRTAFEHTQVDSWVDYAAFELATPGFSFIAANAFGRPLDAAAAESNKAKLTEGLTGLETWLETRTFLVGERLTIADITMVAYLDGVLNYAGAAIATEIFKLKNVMRHYHTVFAVPQFGEGLRMVGHDGFPAEKPKEEKKAEAPKPKEEKKKEEKPAAANDDDGEPLMEEGPKKKNPLDALPPSTMVLDAWKREYSNNDTRTKAAPWFFENFDSTGYSAYWCKYKYNSDLKMQFMTANLVRGWFQRMEGNRKYAFGCVLIVGEEGNHEIRGFWIFRGQPPLPECILDVEDTELFEWTHIPDVKAEKEAITDYLCWEGPTIDKPVMEGRTFK